MRTGVLDVGSNTACLLVVDTRGTAMTPVRTVKFRLRLAERLGPGRELDRSCVAALVRAVDAALAEAHRWGVATLLVYATAVVRDAPNRAEVIEAVRARTGVKLVVLSGEVEAELTFLAARRWAGWQAGSLGLLDIGGGSFEMAYGPGERPDFAVSLPLGAGRLTREFFGAEDPPGPAAVRALRSYVRTELRDVAARMRREAPDTVVATSRTFQQLARLCGAAPRRDGPLVPRRLARPDLKRARDRLLAAPAAERAGWPGISAARARQSAAGAVVAHTAMKRAGVREILICPWALREGALLQHLESAAPAGPAGEECGGAVPAPMVLLAPVRRRTSGSRSRTGAAA
ncbi:MULTISPECIES: Ppx/GppA phosphatase family protein [Streptomyces]|uniref:Ppx/GppA family phosphatase n=1 Tax=Streptomyces lycii TaxID=2654337 RepID=A0ABQ7FJW4_9ACTN|nr:Ppx/GppA family phosphatase [Streptomyces lycii]KAF4407528.1 Ppx/GppA family phosphatase [Streptomyces lycii]